MPTSHALPQPEPLPLPLPLPPPPLSLPSPPSAPRRGRHRASTSSSASSSSSGFCPSPSPAASPPRGSTAATSLVPFSWERHPGVPKASSRDHASPAAAPLQLPLPLPLLRAAPRRAKADNVAAAVSTDRGADSSDQFVAAFAECTRVDDADDDGRDVPDAPVVVPDKLWLPRTTKSTPASGRRWWLPGGAGLVGFLDLYGCKSAMAVADGAFLARRPVVARAHGRRASRR